LFRRIRIRLTKRHIDTIYLAVRSFAQASRDALLSPEGNEKIGAAGETVICGELDFPATVTRPASALHMGVVTRAAKPDLDPETRRRFGRPNFQQASIPADNPGRCDGGPPLLKGAVSATDSGDQPDEPTPRRLFTIPPLRNRGSPLNLLKQGGLVFSYP
jgi:hypothetical protein